jgi:hypothetical protein
MTIFFYENKIDFGMSSLIAVGLLSTLEKTNQYNLFEISQLIIPNDCKSG